nr:hypothetical protein [uncultured Actinotalea sp.]
MGTVRHAVALPGTLPSDAQHPPDLRPADLVDPQVGDDDAHLLLEPHDSASGLVTHRDQLLKPDQPVVTTT